MSEQGSTAGQLPVTIECPVDGCGWSLDATPPEVDVKTLASMFGVGTMAAAASFQHAQKIEDILAQHFDKHRVEEYLRTITRLQRVAATQDRSIAVLQANLRELRRSKATET